jgi:hypothetical protein
LFENADGTRFDEMASAAKSDYFTHFHMDSARIRAVVP